MADVAQAVLADVQRRTQQQPAQQLAPSFGTAAMVDVLNVVDDEPAPRGDVEAYAALLLQDQQDADTATTMGLQETQQQQQHEEGAHLQQQNARRRQPPLEEKRVRNDKLKRVLQAQRGMSAGLLAPSYREGLALILLGSTPFSQGDLDCLYSNL